MACNHSSTFVANKSTTFTSRELLTRLTNCTRVHDTCWDDIHYCKYYDKSPSPIPYCFYSYSLPCRRGRHALLLCSLFLPDRASGVSTHGTRPRHLNPTVGDSDCRTVAPLPDTHATGAHGPDIHDCTAKSRYGKQARPV